MVHDSLVIWKNIKPSLDSPTTRRNIKPSLELLVVSWFSLFSIHCFFINIFVIIIAFFFSFLVNIIVPPLFIP